MRVLITSDPVSEPEQYRFGNNGWNAFWIGDPDWNGMDAHACAFRRSVTVAEHTVIRIHVSADQRYTLYVDGIRTGFGPERGDPRNWFYQTYDLDLEPGRHVVCAIVTWTSSRGALAHLGHFYNTPGFMVYAQDRPSDFLNTGIAHWECLTLHGLVQFLPSISGQFTTIGARTDFRADRALAKCADGMDSAGDWKTSLTCERVELRSLLPNGYHEKRLLRHSVLPAMFEREVSVCDVRYMRCSCDFKSFDEENLKPVKIRDSDAALASGFSAALKAEQPFIFEAQKVYSAILDAHEYHCAWPLLTVSGGSGSVIEVAWAEALFTEQTESSWRKENRNAIDGKFFRGTADIFRPDGSEHMKMEPIWWEAGRYVRITVCTADQPLVLERFKLRETHYPIKFESGFETSDPRWNNVFKISKRAVEMCSHETFFDCPFYEQQMYAGDSRIEMLVTYVMTRDARLPRKAMMMFDESRTSDGVTQSRTPSIDVQVIPPFSLWWVMMVCDYAMWRDDIPFVKERMPGVRAVLETFRKNVGSDGLLRPLPGWNFMDWVPSWSAGIPLGRNMGVNAVSNLQLALTLKSAAGLEEFLGETLLAQRNRDMAERIAEAVRRTFWSAGKGLLAEDPEKTSFSEHTQCLAVLGDFAPEGSDLLSALLSAGDDIAKTTVYFSHYLFEAFAKENRLAEVYERLNLWFWMEDNGFMTTIESPEPSRSDCHAWGAHPLYHAHASFAGIRPASYGFSSVSIRPQPGPLNHIRTDMVHPAGLVSLSLDAAPDGHCSGWAASPAGVPVDMELPDGRRFHWEGGRLVF